MSEPNAKDFNFWDLEGRRLDDAAVQAAPDHLALTKGADGVLSLCYNHLSQKSLFTLVPYLQKHPLISLRLKGNALDYQASMSVHHL